MYVCMYVCIDVYVIYIYIYTHILYIYMYRERDTYTYIYIYMYREREMYMHNYILNICHRGAAKARPQDLCAADAVGDLDDQGAAHLGREAATRVPTTR